MKTMPKILFVILLATVAFMAATGNQAHGLLVSGQLSISGSSTVYPVANDASATFPAYYNGITGNTITLSISQGGSGVAIPNMVKQADDMGEMSRAPTDAEYASMPYLQQYAIGEDSVAIVVNPYLATWVYNLTVTQVADLFETYNNSGVQTPFYTTWNQFNSAAPNVPIQRAVRDPTSGTFDCFYNFFLKPAGFPQTETNSSALAQLAPYTYCQNNIDILDAITGAGGQDYIGFISLGYLHYGGLSAVNIWNPALNTFVVPSIAHVIDGSYTPVRLLWEVVNGTIPANTSSPNFVEGLWIAYLKQPDGWNATTSYLSNEDYIDLFRADMAGGTVYNSTLQPETHLQPTQTQTYPDGKVDISDIRYFSFAYTNYYSNGIYNPYADMNADGKIDYNDIVAFAINYIYANTPGAMPPGPI